MTSLLGMGGMGSGLLLIQKLEEIFLEPLVIRHGRPLADNDDDIETVSQRLPISPEQFTDTAAQQVAGNCMTYAPGRNDAKSGRGWAAAEGRNRGSVEYKETPRLRLPCGAYHGELPRSLHGLAPLELHL